MSPDRPVLVTREGAILVLTLNRPTHGNAIDFPMAEALATASRDAAADPGVRCVVLTGAGRQFCVGGDVRLFATSGEEMGDLLARLAEVLHEAVSCLARMRKPLVVAVNGAAAGAGLSLALSGDVVLAAENAHFTAAYTAIGLSPDGGATWWLPRLVGMRCAQDLLITNRRMSAAEASERGMITRIAAAESLLEDALGVAQGLASGATGALGSVRALLQSSLNSSLEQQLAQEACAIAAAGRSADAREGVAAFIGQRKAEFKGDGRDSE